MEFSLNVSKLVSPPMGAFILALVASSSVLFILITITYVVTCINVHKDFKKFAKLNKFDLYNLTYRIMASLQYLR